MFSLHLQDCADHFISTCHAAVAVSMRCLLIGMLAISLGACESDNEHFCARYQYVYKQLLNEHDLPSYAEMRQQLLQDSRDPKKNIDQAQFMLFVLEDWHTGMRPEDESPRDFCMRLLRWKAYQPATR